MCATNATTVSR